MPATDTEQPLTSAKALTLAAYVSFVPIGIITVLLGPMLPTMSARWSLNYSQAGALFTAQYLASTVTVALSGMLVARRGFRFAIIAGLAFAGTGVALLLVGSRPLGLACIAAYGAGLGLAVPAANLLVAEVNPRRRSATLNLLNFCWSAGAVACPFLVAAAAKSHRVPHFLVAIAGFSFAVAIGIAIMPSAMVEPLAIGDAGSRPRLRINWRHHSIPALGALFAIYVGTENAFGGWVASYSKAQGTMTVAMAVASPAFFYASLMAGRWIATLLLQAIDDVRLAQAGLLLAIGGMTGLVLSRQLLGVAISASLAGFGLSSVYPITIALLSREFGREATKVGSLMFTLSNLGGGSLPWLVGATSNYFGTLKMGLAVPLAGSAAMFILYLRKWNDASAQQRL